MLGFLKPVESKLSNRNQHYISSVKSTEAVKITYSWSKFLKPVWNVWTVYTSQLYCTKAYLYIFPHFPGPSTYETRRSKSWLGVLESGRRGGLMTCAAACCQHLFQWCVPSVPSEAAIVSPNTTCPCPRFCFITSPADLLITCTT